MRPAVEVDAAHPRLGGERHEAGAELVDVALAEPVALLGEHHDAAPLGGLVGQRGELRRVGERRPRRRPAAGTKSVACRLPRVIVPVLSSSSTSTSPAASTARPDMAITLAWIMRSMPAMPIAESRPPMVVGMRQTSSATSTVTVTGVPCPAAVDAVDRERQQRHRGDQEDQRQAGEQDRQRDLVRASSGAWRPRPGRSCGRGRSRRGWR